MLIKELADWFETEPTAEFEQFVMANLELAKRMWNRKLGKVGPAKTFTASSEIGTNLRWFYLPREHEGVFQDGLVTWVQGSNGDFWGWDERIYSSTVPRRKKPFPLSGQTPRWSVEWGRTDLMRVVPRTLSRRADRHTTIGFSEHVDRAACESGMAYYVDAERLLAAVRVLDPIFQVGVHLGEDVRIRLWDGYRVWVTSVIAPEAVT